MNSYFILQNNKKKQYSTLIHFLNNEIQYLSTKKNICEHLRRFPYKRLHKWYEKYLLELRNDINIAVHQRALLGQGSSIQRSITRWVFRRVRLISIELY